jgi:hypothetical protein
MLILFIKIILKEININKIIYTLKDRKTITISYNKLNN